MREDREMKAGKKCCRTSAPAPDPVYASIEQHHRIPGAGVPGPAPLFYILSDM